MKEMKECNNLGDVVGKLVGTIASSTNMDPAAQQSLQENISNVTIKAEQDEVHLSVACPNPRSF